MGVDSTHEGNLDRSLVTERLDMSFGMQGADTSLNENRHRSSDSDVPTPLVDGDPRVNRLALARPSLVLELAGSALDVRRQSQVLSYKDPRRPSLGLTLSNPEDSRVCRFGPRGTAYKNLLGVSWSFMACFSAFLGLLNLQATFNGEVGLYSLVILNVVWMMAAFITPTIIRLIGTKYALVLGYVIFLVYTVTNYHPDWATLVPSSVLLGIGFGPIWASMFTHITTVAIKYAPALKEKVEHLVLVFSGILSFHIQSSQILGNLVSSIILTGGASTIDDANVTDFEPSPANICNNTVSIQLPVVYRHILTSVYVLFDIAGITIACLMIDSVHTGTKFLSASHIFREYFRGPVVSMVKTLFHWKSLLMLPMSVLNGMVLSYMAGRFAKVRPIL